MNLLAKMMKQIYVFEFGKIKSHQLALIIEKMFNDEREFIKSKFRMNNLNCIVNVEQPVHSTRFRVYLSAWPYVLCADIEEHSKSTQVTLTLHNEFEGVCFYELCQSLHQFAFLLLHR
jgi:hypothetical protein